MAQRPCCALRDVRDIPSWPIPSACGMHGHVHQLYTNTWWLLNQPSFELSSLRTMSRARDNMRQVAAAAAAAADERKALLRASRDRGSRSADAAQPADAAARPAAGELQRAAPAPAAAPTSFASEPAMLDAGRSLPQLHACQMRPQNSSGPM